MVLCFPTFLPQLVSLDSDGVMAIQKPQVDSGEEERDVDSHEIKLRDSAVNYYIGHQCSGTYYIGTLVTRSNRSYMEQAYDQTDKH